MFAEDGGFAIGIDVGQLEGRAKVHEVGFDPPFIRRPQPRIAHRNLEILLDASDTDCILLVVGDGGEKFHGRVAGTQNEKVFAVLVRDGGDGALLFMPAGQKRPVCDFPNAVFKQPLPLFQTRDVGPVPPLFSRK